MDRGVWQATDHEVTRVRHDLATKPSYIHISFPGGSDGKESTCNAEDLSSIPELGRSPGGRRGNPFLVFLPGEYSWTEMPGGLQVTGSQKVRHD